MEILFARLVESLITPPGLFLLFIFAGVLAGKKYHHRWSRNIFITGGVLFLVSSLPISAKLLYQSIETVPALTPQQISQSNAKAIVVLGAGRYKNAPEFGQDRASDYNLARLRYAVYLHNKTGLPLLASGGNPLGGEQEKGNSEARIMQRELEQIFKINNVWLENDSANTWENASFSARILKQKNINNIFLVTQAWHMPRAVQAFSAAGLHVIPAPTGFRGHEKNLTVLDFVPSANALKGVQFVLHELIGKIWYAIRYK